MDRRIKFSKIIGVPNSIEESSQPTTDRWGPNPPPTCKNSKSRFFLSVFIISVIIIAIYIYAHTQVLGFHLAVKERERITLYFPSFSSLLLLLCWYATNHQFMPLSAVNYLSPSNYCFSIPSLLNQA